MRVSVITFEGGGRFFAGMAVGRPIRRCSSQGLRGNDYCHARLRCLVEESGSVANEDMTLARKLVCICCVEGGCRFLGGREVNLLVTIFIIWYHHTETAGDVILRRNYAYHFS